MKITVFESYTSLDLACFRLRFVKYTYSGECKATTQKITGDFSASHAVGRGGNLLNSTFP